MFKKHSKIISVILSFALILSMCCLQAAAATDPGETWYVAGSQNLCGGDGWETNLETNKMTFNADTGLYEKIYSQVGADASESNPFGFSFQVCNGAWKDKGGTQYPGSNIDGFIKAKDDITITYNPVSHEVKWSSPSAFTPTVNVYRVAGSFASGAWTGKNDKDKMEYNESTKRYEKTYSLNIGSSHEFKIVKNGTQWIPDGGSNNKIVVKGAKQML